MAFTGSSGDKTACTLEPLPAAKIRPKVFGFILGALVSMVQEQGFQERPCIRLAA